MKESPELIQAAKSGDTRAQTQLVKMYSGRIYNLGIRMLRNNEDAEDLLQEAFITAFAKLGNFQEKSTFYTWIYRIAVNIALGRLREKSKLRVAYSIEEPDFENLQGLAISEWPDYIETRITDKEFRAALDVMLEDLPEKYRSVFVLRDLENLSTQETATMLKLTESNVKVRLMRARLFLRDRLNNYFKRAGLLV